MTILKFNFNPEELDKPLYQSLMNQMQGPSGFNFFNKDYLRISQQERQEEDFNARTFEMRITEPLVFNLKNALISPFGVPYQEDLPVREGLNTIRDIDGFLEARPFNREKVLSKFLFERAHPFLKNTRILRRFYKELCHLRAKNALPFKVKTSAPALFWFDHYFYNFTHFIIEAYPRLFFLKEQLAQYPVILPPPQKTSGYDYYQHISPCIEALNIRPENCIVLEDTGNAFDEIIMPSQMKLHPQILPLAIMQLKQYFYDKAFQWEHDRIYIARDRTGCRNIENQLEIEAILCERYNFKKICMEDFNFIEKINIMARARYLITIDGSSVTNAIFMSPQSKTLIFSPSRFPIYCAYLFAIFELEFDCQICDPLVRGNSPCWGQDNFVVDPKKLIKQIGKLLR